MKELLLLSFCLWLHQAEAQPSATQSNEICRYPIEVDLLSNVPHRNPKEKLVENKVVRQIDRIFITNGNKTSPLDTLVNFIQLYNLKGLPTSVHMMTKRSHCRTELDYDFDTLLTVKKVFYNVHGHDPYARIYGYVYDENGLLISRNCSIVDEKQPVYRSVDILKYDEYHRINSITFYSWENKYEYHCEQNALIIENGQGYKTIQKYNQHGALLEVDNYENGKYTSKKTYIYNENNQISSEKLQISRKTGFETEYDYGEYKKGDIIRHEYNYLPNGLLDQVKTYKNDILQTLFTTEYKYL